MPVWLIIGAIDDPHTRFGDGRLKFGVVRSGKAGLLDQAIDDVLRHLSP